jgi:class 3 adenylate cyclase/tetratricopeptide (TPR) repeat protein
VICPSCQTENIATAKFCVECGTPLAQACPSCSTPYQDGQRFCAECGASLAAPAAEPSAARAAPEPVAERRLVSVLFADLVGFTARSEDQDPEEVRELLSRYFDTCRTLIARYGGTVEKFIGDAVMAVWGAPTTTEDDAERAVRAALELVQAVAALREEAGAAELRARAGVLTGEAAVTVGAEGEGMVAGDLVNTASRIQGVAAPGSVYVGEATRRATERTVVYDDAGEHVLKGKSEPIELWRAVRVVAGARGSMRSSALEAPFVGRDRELRLLKELFHAAAEERKAQLASVTGIAGIGKSRLSWEFEKYIDGLAGDVFWHRGRCLSYGEGVAYWALAEMVRMRCEIAEDEQPASALEKLRATIAEHVPDPEERRWVEPRLAHLLGLEEGAPGDQENLFSAWRILFERLSEEAPTILVFEDMQWADAGLLDFLEYLLEWSRSHPLFVLLLARPELADKRPGWGVGKRSFTSIYLEPLPAQAMNELLAGLVPGLPDDLRGRIFDRAQGVPLYAIETVRMLLDRGLLTQEGNIYRPTGTVGTLEVPETLHALIAARLDGLGAEERRLVQDASVLGKTFTKQGTMALTGLDEGELEPLLAVLVRKEVLSIQADPRSPERGMYSFLQDIVKQVAYETLSRKERRAKHLAAARFLESTFGADEEEVVEVIAAHYVDAHTAAPDAPDADEIRTRALSLLVRAAERAGSLAASVEAQRSFERALELTDDPLVRASLHERAGAMARAAGSTEEAETHFERAVALFESEGSTHPAARVSARLAEVTWDLGRLEQGVERMNRSFELLSEEEADEDLASLAAQLGRFLFFAGDHDLGARRIETALDIAEALWLPETLSQALNTKAVMLGTRGRWHEAIVLLRYALEVALEHDKPSAALRAYYNLADTLGHRDRYEEAEGAVQEALALARRAGNRYWEWQLLAQVYPLYALGSWDELLARIAELPEERWEENRQSFTPVAVFGVMVHVRRGDFDEAKRLVDLFAAMGSSADVQERASYGCGKSRLLLAQDHADEALRVALAALEARAVMGLTPEYMKEMLVTAVEAALELGNLSTAEELLGLAEALPPGQRPQLLQAHLLRFRGRAAALRGEEERVDDLFKGATALFRELFMPFNVAVTELEHGEWLVAAGRQVDAEPLLAEARAIFERLVASPSVARVDRVMGAVLQSGAPE